LGLQQVRLEIALSAPFRVRLKDYSAQAAWAVLGQLISARAASGFNAQYLKQVEAWEEELQLLDKLSRDLQSRLPRAPDWTLLLEYPIPRRNKYPDAIILAEDVIFLIEFKFGAMTFDAAAEWQVEDYALDLRDFHLESHGRTIVPILVATAAHPAIGIPPSPSSSLPITVWPVADIDISHLATYIVSAFGVAHCPNLGSIDPDAWDGSDYRPSFSIIEAASELFAGHAVREISHAYADNLSTTTEALFQAIRRSQQNGLRAIAFITGVPGSGKTLTGLNAVHSPDLRRHESRPGVFLSGNGPLVKILREALVRDAARHRRCSKRQAAREVGTFVQNVHSFMEEYTTRKPMERPFENVVIFDEAQRAWNADRVKKKRGLDRSEPRMMLEIMERCPDWCFIVALVGGGQEITAFRVCPNRNWLPF
jgi:hypothetical protein